MTLLASGTYKYWLDGILQPIEEPWTFDRIDHCIRLHGQRVVQGSVLLDVGADYDGSICKAMQVRWQATPPREIWYWHIGGEQLEWHCKGQPRAQLLDIPADSVMFPLLRAATGMLLSQLTQPRTVVVPSLHADDPKRPLLQPLLSERRAQRLDERRYRYYGGEYGEQGCDCTVDRHGFLQHYRWSTPHGVWDVALEKLQVTPDWPA